MNALQVYNSTTRNWLPSSEYLCTEYDDDILDTLKECETWRRKVHFVSPQIKNRNSVVDLIRHIGERYSYRRATVHLAVHLLDLFMSNHFIAEPRLNLVALTCFYVACKIEENEPNIPLLSKLCTYVEDPYAPADFAALEVTVLKFFDWHLTIPTAATFLDLFALHSLQKEDFIRPPMPALSGASFADLNCRVIESSLAFLDATLMDPRMNNVKPSLLAAACIAAARCLTPNIRTWNPHLTSATGYAYNEVHVLCGVLVFELPSSSSPSPTILTPKRSLTDSGCIQESEDSDGANSASEDTCSSDSGNRTSYGTYKRTVRGCTSFSSSSITSSSDSGETSAKRRKVTED